MKFPGRRYEQEADYGIESQRPVKAFPGLPNVFGRANRRASHRRAVLSLPAIIYLVVEAHMDHLQQLEIECPFCGEMQPRETARWDDDEVGYATICQTCGKVFSGLTLVSAYVECA
jgi:hypothetical protein